ncbi:Uncharacterised protein [Vibrio cholerae]|nr:Uncharacterised protein [Vibrio cholerae]CSI42557.1 Uncharacterised protein [Vibrio cholerae]
MIALERRLVTIWLKRKASKFASSNEFGDQITSNSISLSWALASNPRNNGPSSSAKLYSPISSCNCCASIFEKSKISLTCNFKRSAELIALVNSSWLSLLFKREAKISISPSIAAIGVRNS